MSGRVRWRPWLGYRHVREMRVDGATVGELLTYSDRVSARHYVATPDGSDRRTFSRRSDAKRWLLARAAGLAEVPRRERVFDVYVMPVDEPPPRLSRGYRVAATGIQFRSRVTVTERNRRRR